MSSRNDVSLIHPSWRMSRRERFSILKTRYPDRQSLQQFTRVGLGIFLLLVAACALLAVYVPVIFLGGIVGQLYRQFALTLCFAAMLSILVALTLTPALCVKILRPKKDLKGPLGAFNRGFNRFFDRTTEGYLKGVQFFMRRLGLGLILLLAVYLGAGSLLKNLPGGLVPDEDQGVIFVTFNLPPGSSLERADAVLTRRRNLPPVSPFRCPSWFLQSVLCAGINCVYVIPNECEES